MLHQLHQRLNPIEQARRGIGRDGDFVASQFQLVSLRFQRLRVLVRRLPDFDCPRRDNKIDRPALPTHLQSNPVAEIQALFQTFHRYIIWLDAPAQFESPPAANRKITASEFHFLRCGNDVVPAGKKAGLCGTRNWCPGQKNGQDKARGKSKRVLDS